MNLKNPGGIFYGWWIVAASFVVSMYTGGVIFYGFTAFFEPIVADMDWNYTQVSIAASLRGMESGIISPFVGIAVDRFGPRRVIFIGGIVIAAGLALLAGAKSLVMFYSAFALLAGGGSTFMIAPMIAIANWFQRRIGIANGIAICGFGCSGLLVPVITGLITAYQWRTTSLILAVVTLAIVLPLSFVFRHRPEDYGYLPDGRSIDVDNSRNLTTGEPPEANIKIREAFRNSTFWQMGIAYTYHMMVVNAIVTHVMPYLSSLGIERSLSSLIAMAIPVVSISGRLGLGWLGDKYDKRIVAAVCFAIMGLGIFFFGYTSVAGTGILVPFLILMGIGYGGGNTLRPSLLREYFGRENFGSVFGLMVGIGSIGAIVGPTLSGWAFDNWGTYRDIWYLFAGLAAVAVVLLLRMPRSTIAAEILRSR